MNRIGFIGGSDATIIMSGDPAAILRLWEEKTGRREPEDLSHVLPVQIGIATEALNVRWYEYTTGRDVTRQQDGIHHPVLPWMRATVDGMTTTADGHRAVLECKHVNAFAKIDEVAQRYMPQLHHYMLCAQVEHAILSVFVGTLTYEMVEVRLDKGYADALVSHETAFWNAVELDEPPPGLPEVPPPVPPDKWVTVDMTGRNEWASHAADWLAHKDAAKTFEKAAKGIKGMVEPHVGKAHGHGIQATRAKNGAISIKEHTA